MQGAGGVGGLLMVSEISNSQISNYYPTYDGNGNVSEYLDSTGAIAAHYEYDPFGKTTVATGPKANAFAHRFSTKPLDLTTGLYYYGYRFYDPNSGRWPSRDPIGDLNRRWIPELLPEGPSLYNFVGGDPINWFDPWGLSRLKGTVWMRCLRCKDGARKNTMTCWFEMPDGSKGDPFPTNNVGGNAESTTPGDPYGTLGPIPPGEYDIIPKSGGPKNNQKVDDGTDYRKGTPSITQPGRADGTLKTPKGTHRSGLRIHKSGGSHGCVTCEAGDNSTPDQNSSIENLMNSYEKMKISIKEVCCSDDGTPKAEAP
jgi:RHS repeat-associated protein